MRLPWSSMRTFIVAFFPQLQTFFTSSKLSERVRRYAAPGNGAADALAVA
jgi:hypothetical protein